SSPSPLVPPWSHRGAFDPGDPSLDSANPIPVHPRHQRPVQLGKTPAGGWYGTGHPCTETSPAGLRDARAAGRGEVLPQQAWRTAKRIVEVAERRFPHPFPTDPGIEGVVAAEPDLDHALEPRLPRRDRAQRRPGIDEDAAAPHR